jgi:hypothetical protein
MLEDFLRERQVRKALRAIASQRVAMWDPQREMIVLEKSPSREEWFELGVRTALIRGWVQVLHEHLPTGQVTFQGKDPIFPRSASLMTHYKLTEGGWAVLNRSHAWVLATFLVSAISLFISVAALAVAWISMPKL